MPLAYVYGRNHRLTLTEAIFETSNSVADSKY
jgi:hypothetical protein